MIPILSVAAFFACLRWFYRRYPWAIIGSVFLTISFAWRAICALYVDLSGPIYATELGFDVGPGTSTPLFVLSLLLALGMIVLLQARLQPNPAKMGQTPFGLSWSFLSGLALAVSICWVVLAYGELAGTGVLPLFQGMDRIEFQEQHAGPIYNFSYQMGFIFALIIGFFFAYPRILTGSYDYRFAWVMTAQLVFFALTGNRASIFYLLLGYFVIAIGPIFLLKARGVGLPPDRNRGAIHDFVTRRGTRRIAVALAVVVFIGNLLNNFFNVRYGEDSDLAQQTLVQRSLVQPIELYEVTWQRLVDGELGDTSLAWDFVVNNPIDPTKNTGIQYLMAASLGEQQATEIVGRDSQYAGGYPEVLIELFGVWFAIVPLTLAALAVAFMYRELTVALCYGRPLTFIMTGYLLFSFNLLYIGGMVTFMLALTFWLKLAALFFVRVLEPRIMRVPKAVSSSLVVTNESPERFAGA